MISGSLNGILAKVLRPAGPLRPRHDSLSRPSPQETGRPAVFSLLFWSLLSASYLFWGLGLVHPSSSPGLLPATLGAGVLAAAWLILPWNPRAAPRRKLAAPAFLACAFGVGHLLGGVWGVLAFCPLAAANGTFLFGFRRGIAYAGGILTLVFADVVLSGETFGNASLAVVAYVALASFFVGVCASILEADERREQTQSLLGQLEDAYAELEGYSQRVRELTLAEERARMSREMHDSVGHYLTAINFQLEAAAKLAKDERSRTLEPLERARRFTNEAFLEVRRSVKALGPPAAGDRSGTGAMAALARSFEGTTLEVRFSVEGEERALPEEAELLLYRALQESLSNAARHSGARLVLASLAYGPASAKLVVADDGKGSPDEAPSETGATNGGFGLAALGERVEALGGAFAAGNAPAGGFVVEVELPLPTERWAGTR